MFKKLKDKIAEEVKISPLKLQTTVQQLAQAMVSPSSSVSSIQDSAVNENFSIAEDSEVSETPRNSPEKENSTFHRVELRGDVVNTPPRYPTVSRSRRSSASSMMSDASSLFPLYESPSNAYHFQSDLESTSEIEEIGGSTSHLQGISKEQILTAYRKTQTRYHKYKGRYVDLARHFRELERQNGKIKMVLTETQDRALRKIAELKEQCMLEQKAKAHLEDVLRNDLEEKDHLISTLETKVKLLKDVDASKTEGTEQNEMHEGLLVYPIGNKSEALVQNDHSLQEKLVQLEKQVLQYQESLSEQSEKLHFLNLEKKKVDNALSLEVEENKKLKRQLESQRKREEEAALSLAENKMQVHRELEAREEEAKNLKALVTQLQEDLKISNRKKVSGNGESLESISGSMFEDLGGGGDGLPLPQPVSDLIQLKELLRGKYKEVKDLVAENGKLRASLLMASSENGCFESKLSVSEHREHFLQSELEIDNGGYAAKESGSGISLQVQSSEGDDISQEVELKNLSDDEALNESNELNKKSMDLVVEEHLRNIVGRKRQLSNVVSELKNELKRIDAEWKCKYDGVKEELDELVAEKEEMRRLLVLEEIPSELTAENESAVAENRNDLLGSLISILKEKSKWKREEKTLISRLQDVDHECDSLKVMLKTLEDERTLLCGSIEQSKNEVNQLNGEVKNLKQLANELKREKDDLEGEVVTLKEIAKNVDQLKNELESVHMQSKIDAEKIREECLLEVSSVIATLEGKENELEQVKTQLEHSISLNAVNDKVKELTAHHHCLEEEILKERELRLSAEYSAKAFCEEFMKTLNDGKLILHESYKNVETLEQEVDRLNALCEGLYLREEETKNVIRELQKTYGEQLYELERNGKRALIEVESLMKERDGARKGEAEAQKKAANAISERNVLKVKKEEAESRAAKVEKELKAMRELEEKAKVEAEEVIHEQEAMRRSWEMQRDQIESMSQEIEGLKKAEDGLIRVVKEVREEVESKDNEIKRLVEESLKEKNVSLMNEERIKNDVCGLKNLIEEQSMREDQVKKEMEKVKATMAEWRVKSDDYEKELECLRQKNKSLQENLEIKEEEALKSAEAFERLSEELAASVRNEKEIELELVAMKEEINLMKSDMHANEKKGENLNKTNEELMTLKKNLEEEVKVFENERDRLIRQAQEAEKIIIKLDSDKEKYKRQAEKYEEELERVEIFVRDCEKRCSETEIEAKEKEVENKRLKEKLEETEKELLDLRAVSEMLGKEEEWRKEAKHFQSKDLERSKSAEDGELIERMKGNELCCEHGEGNALMQKSKSDKDEAWKNLEIANIEVKAQEENMSLSDNVRKEELRKEPYGLKEKSYLRNKELKGEEFEKSLVKVQLEALKKEELQARVKDLEKLMEKMEKEFDAAIADKEEEHQKHFSSYSERMEEEVDFVRKQFMHEIKELREELIVKEDAHEELLKNHSKMVNENRVELDTIRRMLSEEKERANNAVENETSRWMTHISEIEAKHKTTINELQSLWDVEKKDLVRTTKLAVAAVESGTGSLSYMKEQIQAQTKELFETKRKYSSEVLELRHLLSLGRKGIGDMEKSRLDDSTELEYLRNILYEYMMGKEPMILARVIAAVVKFDEEQTKKILTKEEQKQTLLGQFGLT